MSIRAAAVLATCIIAWLWAVLWLANYTGPLVRKYVETERGIRVLLFGALTLMYVEFSEIQEITLVPFAGLWPPPPGRENLRRASYLNLANRMFIRKAVLVRRSRDCSGA